MAIADLYLKEQTAQQPSTLRAVAHDVGGLLIILGGLLIVPVLVSLLYGEWYTALALFATAGVSAAIGVVPYHRFREASATRLRDAMIVAAVGWLAIALVGALPFVFAAAWTPVSVMNEFVPVGASFEQIPIDGTTTMSSIAYYQDPIHALFESMSGYTTTGLTMSVHEPTMGHGLLFYRSFMQWVGGAGMIVLALAILRQPGGASGYLLYQAETREERLRPSIVSTARTFWKVYVAVTAVVAIYLAVATFLVLPGYGIEPTIFDAVNHAMTGQSTGGFSTLDDSIAGYDSYAMELVHIPPMALGAIAIPLYFLVYERRSLRVVWRDPQAKALGVLFVAGSLALIALLARATYPLEGSLLSSEAVRVGLFQYISALSTTGWQTADIGAWAATPVLFIVLAAMIIGGSAGATVGGIKIIRAVLIAKAVQWEVTRVLLPQHAVKDLRVGDRTLSEDEANDELRGVMAFTFAYFALLAIGLIVITMTMGPEFTLADAVFEVATAQGTVGLSAGITGPSMPRAIEVLFILSMWLGRLEIIPIAATVAVVLKWLKVTLR